MNKSLWEYLDDIEKALINKLGVNLLQMQLICKAKKLFDEGRIIDNDLLDMVGGIAIKTRNVKHGK